MPRRYKIAIAGILIVFAFFAIFGSSVREGETALSHTEARFDPAFRPMGESLAGVSEMTIGPGSLFDHPAWKARRADRNAKKGHVGDRYFTAFMTYQKALASQEDGNGMEAIAGMRDALSQFDAIAKDFPDWKQKLLDFRRKGLAEQIAELKAERKGV